MRDPLGRFKPGSSGNPRGRPVRREPKLYVEQNEKDFFEAMNSKVTIVENGRQRKVTIGQAIKRQLIAQATKGDLKAIIQALKQYEQHIEKREKRRHELTLLLLQGDQRVLEQPERVSDDFLETLAAIRKQLQEMD